jgi:16S rRNA G966 N2-methylase RsmD
MTYEEFKNINPEYLLQQVELYKKLEPSKIAFQLNRSKKEYGRIIAEQVANYKKAKLKFPKLSEHKLLYDKIAIEQASGEATAKYKSELIYGARLIDLTGGLGIDDIFFSTRFNSITYCESNNVISSIFDYNIHKLNIDNISVKNTDSICYLSEQENGAFDWIYIDPSRRDGNRRSVDLAYCTPNVYKNLNLFLVKSQNLMIKAAPAYDITEAVKKFGAYLSEIHVISVNGECKETLLILSSNRAPDSPNLKVYSVTINAKNNTRTIFEFDYYKKTEKSFSKIKDYLFIPDCAIIKANHIAELAKKNALFFINKRTYFLTSERINNNIAGRYFKITDILKFNEKNLRSYLTDKKIKKANINTKGTQITVDEIRKRLKLKEGGNTSLFITSDLKNKTIVIVAEKFNF